MTTRIALAVAYDGAAYHGWQRQRSPELPTVQADLEKALSRIAAAPIRVHCAGRTDSGVHATAQIVHFDAPVDRGAKAWRMGSNSLLPKTVRVLWAIPVEANFHARFSALSRRYRYVILQQQVAPAILSRQVTHIRDRVDVEAMDRAGRNLIGEHDFSAFRAAGCQSNSPWRNVMQLRVQRYGPFIVLDIRANAFLQHMVRNIAGALLAVGRGDREADWTARLLETRDRKQGAVTASPNGLYLVDVEYPGEYGLPAIEAGPIFLSGMPATEDH